jgi:hypothetical protein
MKRYTAIYPSASTNWGWKGCEPQAWILRWPNMLQVDWMILKGSLRHVCACFVYRLPLETFATLTRKVSYALVLQWDVTPLMAAVNNGSWDVEINAVPYVRTSVSPAALWPSNWMSYLIQCRDYAASIPFALPPTRIKGKGIWYQQGIVGLVWNALR